MSKPFGWIPVGPSTLIAGAGESQPRVTGRVRDIAVSPDGKRAYVAAAGGGVWYSSDTGNTWSPLGNWMPTPTPPAIFSPASALSCGCLLVTFGAAADGSQDDVYVGTGELNPELQRGTPGARLGGVGVLHLAVPLQTALQKPFDNPWKREASNLTGLGIFRLARDPRPGASSFLAATSNGLYFRTGSFVENAEWTKVLITGEKELFGIFSTDAMWLPGGRLWVADAGNDSRQAVIRFADPAINKLPEFPDASSVRLSGAASGRLTFGTPKAAADPPFFYVLGTGPNLWRVQANSATPIAGLPGDLFSGDNNDQSMYDSAIAVHPDDNDTVVLGGAGRPIGGNDNASLYRFKITAGAQGFLSTDFQPGNEKNFIGLGVHPDVHQVTYAGADRSLWVTCDGGVFRSAKSGDRLTFASLNTGLPALELGYVANHPVSDAYMIAGGQDNGIVMRVGDTVWTPFTRSGDGGSVMFHPVDNTFFFGQVKEGEWVDSRGTLPPPVERPQAPHTTESSNSLFYSGGDIRKAGAEVRVAIGTHRVWLVKNWNTATNKNSWVTLPSGDDPLAAGTGDIRTDRYGRGTGKVVTCRWMSDTRLLVLVQSGKEDGKDTAVLLLEDKGVKAWDRIELSKGQFEKEPFPNLPPIPAWSEIGIHDPARQKFGSFYVATTGFVQRKSGQMRRLDSFDTLYWFDGDKRWTATGLSAANTPPDNVGTAAPAYAVVCDPDNLNTVYVGTSVGVWQGTLSFDANNLPGWKWKPFSADLPQVAIQDLSIYKSGTIKLLRAATQSRGVWEVDLATASPPSLLFLRVHPNDSRRQSPAPLANPTDRGPHPWIWYASPDIRIRPASGGTAPSVPASLSAKAWTRGEGNFSRFDLWTFQTALRKTDPRCRPTGTWTPQFEDCVTHVQHAAGEANNSITRNLWTTIVTSANGFADPWDGQPSEADLFELIVEDTAIKRDPFEDEVLAGPPQKSFVQKRKYKIDVLVHYRDLVALDPAKVKVTLLFRKQVSASDKVVPKTTIPATFSGLVAQLITGGAPVLPDNWKVADIDATKKVRSPSAPVDVTTPRVVTFDMDFSSAAKGDEFALLAVVHRVPDQGTDTGPTLTGATLEELVLQNFQAASRVVVVKG